MDKALDSYMHDLLLKAKLNSVPVTGTLELTARCNFNCKMCYIHDCSNSELKKKELSREFWYGIIDKLKKAGTLSLLLTGGEAMVRDDFADIYSYCKDNGFVVTVNSNGSLIDDDMIELFREKTPVAVNISLYGMSDDTYKNVGSSEKMGISDAIKRSIVRLNELGIEVGINLTVTQYNKSDIDELFTFAKKHDIIVKYADYIFPSREGKSSYERMSYSEVASCQYHIEQMKYGRERFSERIKFIQNSNYDFENDNPCLSESERLRCNAGTCSFWITYDGRMLPCGLLDNIAVDLKTFDIADAWKIITKKTAELRLPSKCTSCQIRKQCEVCAAICYAESEQCDVVPEYLCNKTKDFIELMRNSEL